jgi:hypothetical protein
LPRALHEPVRVPLEQRGADPCPRFVRIGSDRDPHESFGILLPSGVRARDGPLVEPGGDLDADPAFADRTRRVLDRPSFELEPVLAERGRVVGVDAGPDRPVGDLVLRGMQGGEPRKEIAVRGLEIGLRARGVGSGAYPLGEILRPLIEVLGRLARFQEIPGPRDRR